MTDSGAASAPPRILVDGDACPVKQEVYRVAGRHGLAVVVVANAWLRVPAGGTVEFVLVSKDLDAADDWIAAAARPGDVVITADIPLAARCLEAGARAVGPTGRPFTEESIGEALATRALLAELRGAGERLGGPPPLAARDRSLFLQRLDEAIRSALRERAKRPPPAES